MLTFTEAVPLAFVRVKGAREMATVQSTHSSGQAKMAETFPRALPRLKDNPLSLTRPGAPLASTSHAGQCCFLPCIRNFSFLGPEWGWAAKEHEAEGEGHLWQRV